jgi:hypothetical protein
MRRNGGRAGSAVLGVPALGMALLLGGCTWFDNASYGVADALSNTGTRFGAPWGGMRPATPEESTTIQRVRGLPSTAEVLQTEPGNVWPVEEAPRATLANPDAALRGIPSYQPGQPRDLPPTTGRGVPGRLRGSSSPPPPPLDQPDFPSSSVARPLPPLPERPPARVEGQVIPTPQGPAVTSGGTDRIQSFTRPGGGGGVIHRDGPNATIIGPDGQVQVVPVPR